MDFAFPGSPRIAYVPPANLVTHANLPIPAEMDFFVAPPPEIGEVMSGYSTLTKTKNPVSLATRAIWCVVGLIAILLCFELLIAPNVKGYGIRILVYSFALLGVVIVLIATRFKHICSYVGATGVVRYTLKGSREAAPEVELLEFANAEEVRTSSTNHYHNGIYTGTNYNYTWSNAQGARLFTLKGQYRSKEQNPKPKDPFHFARMAEIAWSAYLFDALADQLEAQGYIQFNLDKANWLRLGPGFLEFCQKGHIARIQREEIRDINLNSGTFTVYHHDAKWYSSSGKYSFQYGSMANARLFLIALDRLLGFRFG